MTSLRNEEKRPYEEYGDWYSESFSEDPHDGKAETWYKMVADSGITQLERSDFWQVLLSRLPDWNEAYMASHQGYPLLSLEEQGKRIDPKPYESCLDKSYRWNIRENDQFPNPPAELPTNAGRNGSGTDKQHDPSFWFNPGNWFYDFPDIFRTRLATVYFDGVPFLLERIEELALMKTIKPPQVSLRRLRRGITRRILWFDRTRICRTTSRKNK